MEFEWDEQKARLNRQKHGVDFRDAVQVFFDFARIEAENDHMTEERYRVIGRVYDRILFVVYNLARRSHSDHFSKKSNRL